MVIALGLMIAAGVISYRQRRQEQQALLQGEKMVLVPANPGGAPDASAVEESAGDDYTTPLNGQQAPNFTLSDLAGKPVSLSTYKGRPMIVDFWATWCGPCKMEIPWLEDFQKQYGSQGLQVIGISADDLDKDDPAKLFTEKREIGDFAAKMHMNYPVLLGADAIADSYGGVDALPTTFFIDRSGKIVASTVGLPSEDELRADLQKALASGAHS